jgi:hypothetical protein
MVLVSFPLTKFDAVDVNVFNVQQRPVNEAGERITPSGLLDYRMAYVFQAPCCLCASVTPGSDYTESAIYVPIGGEFVGEYVAACATDSCGYMCKLLIIWNSNT